MSMTDDLEGLPELRPGPKCVFQKIRETEGDERYIEIMELMAVDAPASSKHKVLARHGYDVDRQIVERHTPARMQSRNGCKGCLLWLSSTN